MCVAVRIVRTIPLRRSGMFQHAHHHHACGLDRLRSPAIARLMSLAYLENIQPLRGWPDPRTRILLRKESWDAGPGRPRRAARTGLFIVSGGTGFAIMDYKLILETSNYTRETWRPTIGFT